jgi:hypothetical protein
MSRRLLVSLLSLVVLVGCTASPTQTGFSDITGLYLLQVPDGETLTVRYDRRADSTILATGGMLDLHPNWRFHLNYSVSDGSRSVTGSYRKTDSGVELRYASGMVQTGSLSGTELTLHTDQGPLVFQLVE